MSTLIRALPLCAWALLSGSASADLSITEMQAIIGELGSRSIQQEPECANFHDDARVQVFLFEGAGGYCPRYAYMNLDVDHAKKTRATHFAETRETVENIEYIREIRSLLSREFNSRLCNTARNIEQFQYNERKNLSKRVRFHYYSKNGYEDAIRCIKSQDNGQKIRIFGYSMGGYAALQVAQELERDQRPIEQVFTLDAVGQKFNWISGVFCSEDNKIFERTSNVALWTNVFQKFDEKSVYDSPWLKLGARGSRVIGADENIDVPITSFETLYQREFTHIAIHLVPETQERLRQFLLRP